MLYNYDCVIVPGFGAFVLNYKPATINLIQDSFSPPAKDIIFNSVVNRNDGLLADYISTKINATYDEALLILKDSVEELKINLNLGKKVSFKGLGIFSINREGNYQFDADKSLNLYLGAYGMISFNSPSVSRIGAAQRIEKKIRQKDYNVNDRKLISTVAWSAAASILVLVIVTLTFFSTDVFRKNNMNYSGVFSYFISRLYNNDISKPVPEIAKPVTIAVQDSSSFKSDSLNNALVENKSVDENEVTLQSESNPAVKYYIIGGCFSIEENANNFVKELKEKGFDAVIIGKTNRGLVRVAYSSHTDQSLADNQLSKIHSSENPGAWMLTIRN